MFLLVIFILIFFIYYQLYLTATKSRRNLKQRLAKYTEQEENDDSREISSGPIGDTPRPKGNLALGLKNLAKVFTKIDKLKGILRYLDSELIKSGILLRGEEFISILALTGIVVGILFYMLTTSLIGGVIGIMVGVYAPWLVVRVKKQKRQNQFNEQLGEVLTTVANALRSGNSLLKAMEMVSKDSSYPASQEFSYTVKEMQLGISTEEALKNMETRIESEDLSLVVSAILIQRQVGGNLAEVLDSISETIRDRLRIHGEIKTLTAQGKLSGIIISLLPVLLGIFFYIINPDYIMQLFTDPMGLMLVAMAVLSQMIGALLIKKIIEIEV